MSKRPSEREQLPLFRALPGEDMALRDAQDLMAYPFFSLAKSRRTVPIRFDAGDISSNVATCPAGSTGNVTLAFAVPSNLLPNGGSLATFDQGIALTAVADAQPRHLTLL